MSAATRPEKHVAETADPNSPGARAAAAKQPRPQRPSLPIKGAPGAPPVLPALTGLALFCAPFAVAGGVGSLITLDSGYVEGILAGCTVGFDLLLVLCGVRLVWRNPATRKGLWSLGVGPLLAGLGAISAAALWVALDPPTAAVTGLTTLGRALAGIGTGTLTVYWLRANTGSVRPPAHRPALPDRARTSRTAPLLAFVVLVSCAIRPDFLASAYLIPVYLASAWLVVTLIRAPHSPLTRGLARLGRLADRPKPQPRMSEPQGPIKRQIVLPDPRRVVARSGRVIDLDEIPAELRLLPLPRKPGQKEQQEQPGPAVQTE